MKNMGLIFCAILMGAMSIGNADDHVSFGDPNIWIAQQLEFKEGGLETFQQGLSEFMQSDLGKKHPGNAYLNWLMINGENPATHGFVMTFPSIDALGRWNTAFWTGGSPEAAKWVQTFGASVESVRDVSFTRVASWGSVTSNNPLTETVPIYTEQLPLFVERFATWMGTKTAKKFNGSVAIHQCAYCGDSETNALLTVSHNSSAELDEWRTTFATSEEAATWFSEAMEISEFPGNSLIYRMASFPVNSKSLLAE